MADPRESLLDDPVSRPRIDRTVLLGLDPPDEEELALIRADIARTETRVGTREEQEDIRNARLIAEQAKIDRESSTTIGEDIARAPGQLAAGGVTGIGGMLNLGAEALSLLSQGILPGRLPGGVTDTGQVQGTVNQATAALNENFEPALSTSDRLFRNIGEEAGASLLTGPLIRGGGQAFRALSPIIPPGTARAARQTLGVFLQDEALAIVGGGVGRTVVGPEAGTASEVTGGLTGAVGFTLGGKSLRGLGRGFQGLKGTFGRRPAAEKLAEELNAGKISALVRGNGSTTRLGKEVAASVRDILGNRAQADEALKLVQESPIPAGRFVIGAAADIPGIRKLQAQALSRNTEVATIIEGRRGVGMGVLSDQLYELGGTPGLRSEDAGLIAMEMNISKRLSRLQDEAREAVEALEREAGDLVPDAVDPAAHGRLLSEQETRLLHEMYDEAVVAKDKIYGEIDILGQLYDAQWDPAIMIRARAKTLAAAKKFEKKALPPSDLMDDIASLPSGGAPWEDLQSLERRLNDELRNPKNSKNQNRLLGILRDALSDTQAQLVRDPDSITFINVQPSSVIGVDEILEPAARIELEAARRSELAVKMGNARSFFKLHARMFREGIADAQLTRSSNQGPAADALLRKYLHAGTKDGAGRDAKAFLTTFGQNEEALGIANDYLVGEGYRASLIKGRVDRQKLGQWLRGYSAVLSHSEFSGSLHTLRDVDRLVERANLIGIPSIDDVVGIQNAALRKYLSSPNQVFTQIAGAPNPRGEIQVIMAQLREHGEEDAITAFRARFWDHVVIRSGRSTVGEVGTNASIPVVKPSHIDKVMADPSLRPMIEELYGPEHIENLRLIANEARRLETIPTGLQSGGGDIPSGLEDFSQGLKKSSILSVIMRTTTKVIRGTIAAVQFRKSLTQTQIDTVLEMMVKDQTVAELMLREASEGNVLSLRRYLGTNVPSIPFRLDESKEIQDQDRLRRAERREFDENGRPIVFVEPEEPVQRRRSNREITGRGR